jgi:kelch-like protein 10
MTKRASLALPRKDHVYVLGGYDQQSKLMLKSCERYSLCHDVWEAIADMTEAKCAFAAASDGLSNIYIFGGFDGKRRLASIERYSVEQNTWVRLEFELR